MPYKIRKSGRKWKVVSEKGKVKGTHSSEKDAKEQLRALYANVPDARRKK